MTFRLLLFLTILFMSMHGTAQPGWQLRKEKNNIKVYTKKSDTSQYRSIRVEAVLEGSLDKLFPILMDINSLNSWVYRTKKAYTVKKLADNEVIYYTETALPWPMSNRDVVIWMKLLREPASGIYRITSTNQLGMVPEKSGLVRIPYYRAEWKVSRMEKNRISISYLLDIQPGGGLKPWVVNMFITSGPYETFSRLAELLKGSD